MKEEFDARVEEVELYFSFLRDLESDKHRIVRTSDSQLAYSASDSVNMNKMFKANGFLLLYNLMESTVKNAVQSIYDDLQDKGVDFDSCREEVRRVILKNLKNWNVERIFPSLTMLAKDVVSATFRKEKIFSGNVDARAIRDTAKGYGFKSPGKKSDELLTVKTNRNDLAHGNKSFSDVGRDYDVPRLVRIKDEVVEYLKELIANIEDYIAGQEYLASA